MDIEKIYIYKPRDLFYIPSSLLRNVTHLYNYLLPIRQIPITRLSRVAAFFWTAVKYYLNQYSLIIKIVIWYSSESNLIRNTIELNRNMC